MSESPSRGYAVELVEEEDGTWTAEVPDLPGAVAAGASWAEAVASVGDAIDAWVESARADGLAVPAPTAPASRYSGRFLVRVPRSLHRAAAQHAARDGVSLNTYCVAALSSAVSDGLAGASTRSRDRPAR
jgi:antitoxin HicB